MTHRDYNWQPAHSPFVQADREYLLVGDARDKYWVAYSDAPIPSQLLRKIAVERSGLCVDWDWRRQPSVELMCSTLGDFRQNEKGPDSLAIN